MSRIVVAPGSFVRQGQLIGYVGSSGLSTGPHLHYEVYRGGEAVNPLGVRFANSALLQGPELDRFKTRLAQLMAIGTEARPKG
jgi:murein DD-endopeptidase MepM/ murein hydrolase activator NlpD